MIKQNKKIAIIGSGFGGLATACLLGKKGYEVEIFEKNEQIGGRASSFQAKGYTFDMGPSWYLMPDIFENFFNLLEEDINDYLNLKRLSPSYRVFFANKENPIDIFSDINKTVSALESFEPELKAKLKKYLEKSEYQYEIAKKDFIYRNYNSILDMLDWKVIKDGIKMSVFRKMDSYVKKHFSSDELQKLMQYSLVFLGSSPYNTPAIYNIMSHIDFNLGVFYPEGGFNAVAKSLESIAKKYNVKIHTNHEVTKINVNKDKKAESITINNQTTRKFDLIVSNANFHWTETKLLDKQHQTYNKEYWSKKVIAPSAVIIYLGIKKKLPQLQHHNLYFSQDWQQNFKEIFDTPMLPNDPSYYVCAPSITESKLAPNDKENLFILIPTAPGLESTEKAIKSYAQKIITHLGNLINEPLVDLIDYQKIFTKKDFQERYHSFKGSALGLAHTMSQTATFRPNNISKKVSNLYYVGANTNPGIGVPMCLISAELVYKRLHNINHPHPLNKL